MVSATYNMAPQKFPPPPPISMPPTPLKTYLPPRLSIIRKFTWLCGLVQPREVVIGFYAVIIFCAIFFGLPCGADIGSTCSPLIVSALTVLRYDPLMITTPNTVLLFFSWYLILSSLIALFGLRILEHESSYGYHINCGLRPCVHPVIFFIPAVIAQIFLFVFLNFWIVDISIAKFIEYTQHDDANIFTYAFYVLHVVLPLLTFVFWIFYVFYGVSRAILFFLVARNRAILTPGPTLMTQRNYMPSAPLKTPQKSYSPSIRSQNRRYLYSIVDHNKLTTSLPNPSSPEGSIHRSFIVQYDEDDTGRDARLI